MPHYLPLSQPMMVSKVKLTIDYWLLYLLYKTPITFLACISSFQNNIMFFVIFRSLLPDSSIFIFQLKIGFFIFWEDVYVYLSFSWNLDFHILRRYIRMSTQLFRVFSTLWFLEFHSGLKIFSWKNNLVQGSQTVTFHAFFFRMLNLATTSPPFSAQFVCFEGFPYKI